MTDCKNCLHYEVCGYTLNSKTIYECDYFTDESRIIELPCKVGDYVYSIVLRRGWYLSSKDSLPKVRVVFVGLTNPNYMGGGYFEALYEDNETQTFYFSDIGELVFLTREEAEQALKEIKDVKQ